jgi:5-methylthioribose kinase
VLKQSRSQLRTREPWFSNLDRVFREADVMRVLGRVLPQGVVPQVLFEDHDHYCIAMSAAPADHRVWKASLLAGDIELELGWRAGDILGMIHAGTAGDSELAQQFDDHEVFIQLRVEPFYWRLQPRHPDLAGLVSRIVEEMFRCRLCLTHADYSPKNLLVHPQGMTLVDHETGHWGDPAFDLGFFLSHLMLKAIHRYEQRSSFIELTRVFWEGYWNQMHQATQHDSRLADAELTRRAIGHLALCALARIDGTSPVDYLTEELQREAVRRLSFRLLNHQCSRWEAVLAELDSVP